MTKLEYGRRQRSWSQTEIAYLARMHQPDVSAAETGRRALTPGYARRLARILGIPADQLLDDVAADEAGVAVR